MIGLIGQKLGMTQIFSEEGNAIPVSVIKIDKNVIIDKKTSQKDGYNALVLGTTDLSEKKSNKSYKNQFKNNIPVKRHLKEFRVENADGFEVGQEFDVETLNDIAYVDVFGTSKGKGFQGVMKKYGFRGGPASHGSKFKRDHGSTGQNTYPAHCLKGVKRAGRMGYNSITIQSLKVVKIDKENNVVLIKGSIPGVDNGIVFLKKSCKRK
jgi:large subunit ribosomal protein L3